MEQNQKLTIEQIKQMHAHGILELVNHPNHYQIGGIETIDVIKTVLTKEEYIGFLKGNIVKYRERAPYKGNKEQDYAKARTYMRLLEDVENE